MSPEVVEPIPENVKIYNEKQEIFHDLYYSVKELYPRIEVIHEGFLTLNVKGGI